MKTKILSVAFGLTLCLGALAQGNLTLNGQFDAGGANWSTSAGGTYFYVDGSDSIASIGWWSGCSIWQNTTATIQAGMSYDLSVRARVGQAPLTGLNVSFQDVTTGWTWVASQDFVFSAGDQGNPGPWETFTLPIDASLLSGRVGDTIGVGVQLNENPNTQYGWIHLDSIQLTAVPEPGSGLLLCAGLLMWRFLRRRS